LLVGDLGVYVEE